MAGLNIPLQQRNCSGERDTVAPRGFRGRGRPRHISCSVSRFGKLLSIGRNYTNGAKAMMQWEI
jgi:hypothetical protein